ncbi:unnamed protein product [Brachionus calyciflorus]|uniref:Uncharacterized protein n=1 Tax=Brachionus calyciflorus TaxID=104777 RepID=A0A814QJI9_9BILA|nr:unnamed protein product [Brachionus calyciflorus]
MSVQTETVDMGQIELENQSIPTPHDCLIELNEFVDKPINGDLIEQGTKYYFENINTTCRFPKIDLLQTIQFSRGLSQDIFRLTQLLCNIVYDNDHILEIYKYKSNKDSCIEKDDLEDIYTVIEDNAIE